MPKFNFSVSKKETVKKKSSDNSKLYETVENNVKGVVFIDIEGLYTVRYNGKDYNLTENSYNCKNHYIIYRRGYLDDNNKNSCIIREDNKSIEAKHINYLPFAPGCIVIGNIIQNGFKTLFEFSKVCFGEGNSDSTEARQFYIANSKTINKKINDRWKDKFK